MSTRVVRLPESRAGEVVDVLTEAFFDYPVMHWVLDPAPGAYADRLRSMVSFSTAVRFLRNDLVLAVLAPGGQPAAVATVIPPGELESPAALQERRERFHRELGPEARRRYEAFGEATGRISVDAPHYFLAMIGVRATHAGQGLARLLLDDLHARSQADPGSSGVVLTTENPENVPLYEHFGYGIVGHVAIAPGVESWKFFRPDGAVASPEAVVRKVRSAGQPRGEPGGPGRGS